MNLDTPTHDVFKMRIHHGVKGQGVKGQTGWRLSKGNNWGQPRSAEEQHLHHVGKMNDDCSAPSLRLEVTLAADYCTATGSQIMTCHYQGQQKSISECTICSATSMYRK